MGRRMYINIFRVLLAFLLAMTLFGYYVTNGTIGEDNWANVLIIDTSKDIKYIYRQIIDAEIQGDKQ